MKPQEPPPDGGYLFAVSRAIITTTYYASLDDAQDVYNEMVHDDHAIPEPQDSIIDTLWDYSPGYWQVSDTTEFPAKDIDPSLGP